MIKAILFSGGRTSGYMLRRALDTGLYDASDTVVIFCNTGKERTQTLDFVRDVEKNFGVEVVWLEYHRVLASTIQPGIFPTARRNDNLRKAAEAGETTHWFRRVDYHSASRNGEPFDELLEWMSVLPNVIQRACSMQLKIRTAMRYLFSVGHKEYAPIIGIRKDEENRATEILANCDGFEHPQFPLIAEGATKQTVNDFWKLQSFDLQLKDYEGNCDLCFLKARWKRIRLIKENPGMVDWWKGWESRKNTGQLGDGKFFRLGQPYSELELEAINDAAQDEFCFANSTDVDIPCSCAEKAFSAGDEP